MKYVILEGTHERTGDTHEVPFIFPGIVNHSDFKRFRRYEHLRDVEIVAAGFVSFAGDGVAYCDGRSETLNMESRGAVDAEIINRANRHWNSTVKDESIKQQ